VADIDFARSARIQPRPTLCHGTFFAQDAVENEAPAVTAVAGHPVPAEPALACAVVALALAVVALALAVVAPPNPTAPSASRLSPAAATRRLTVRVRAKVLIFKPPAIFRANSADDHVNIL
jgi:CHASE1-domain containing sensor protein